MLKDFIPRPYQQKIFESVSKRNSLVVLPTGLGKTAIAILLAAQRLDLYSNSKIVVLAPTRPLAEQHVKSFSSYLDIPSDQIVLFTGFVKPAKRVELWESAKIIVSTPQGLENDIISSKILLNDVGLLVFDEAHRAVKDYSYVYIAKKYHEVAKHERVLALTASPGSDLAKIEEVCQNLFIENIEIRTEKDSDIKEFVQDVDIKWLEVDFPKEFLEIKVLLETSIKKKVQDIKELGYFQGSYTNLTRMSLLSLQGDLRSRISSGEKDFGILKSISLLAEIMKLQHGLELLESQGLEPTKKYFEKLKDQAVSSTVKAVKNLVADSNFTLAFIKLSNLLSAGVVHPKQKVLKDLIKHELSNKNDVKIIIFTQYRSTSSVIKRLLDSLGISSKTFIGQGNKEEKGLSQKKQKEILEEFSNGEFNCLISTSVGEEGLDIPQVGLVVFYEPIPSAIRSIQRRGRTGRLEKGKVFILMTRKTRDEAYRWSAYHKEKKMYVNLNKLKSGLNKSIIKEQKNIQSFSSKEDSSIEEKDLLTIDIDYREKGSKVMKKLADDDVLINLKRLEVGDYQISDRVVVEYKTKKDFVDSIIDGRLLSQARDLSRCLKPIIMIEGEDDIYSQRNIHPNAIRGMISTIALSFRIAIIFTKNPIDSAEFLKTIAKREQGEKKEYYMHSSKPLTLKEQQEYLVSALPNIGPSLSKPLLSKFGSVKKVFNASIESLKKVDLIGDKKAQKIREVIDSEYLSDDK